MTVSAPIRTTFVSAGMTAWAEISTFAGETLTSKTPRTGRFYNDRINPFYKEGFLLVTGEVLVIQHDRMSGDMKVALFENRDAQRAYEEEGDKMVADPETGRRPSMQNLTAAVEVYEAPARIALATPVRLLNGVEGVISDQAVNDPERYKVSWFDRHFWAVRHRWASVQQFVVLA